MERISALIEKLRNQFADGADIEQLLLTTQLLEGELRYHRQKGTIPASPHVAVLMPNNGHRTMQRQEPARVETTPNRLRENKEEPTYTSRYEDRPAATPNRGYEAPELRPEPAHRPEPVREVQHPEHERYMPHKEAPAASAQQTQPVQPAAFAPVQQPAPMRQTPPEPVQQTPPAPVQSTYIQPTAAPVHPELAPEPEPIAPPPPAPERTREPEPIAFNPIKDVPTLTHQLPQEVRNKDHKKDLNDIIGGQGAPSLNDRLKSQGQQREISSVLTEAPIRDLRKAIGINDRYVFISELFRGDETMYERSVKTINNFSIYQEAYYWMERELKLKLAWDTDRKSTELFYQLVRRRFS